MRNMKLAGAPATLPQENRIAKVSSKEEAKQGAKGKQMAGSSHPVQNHDDENVHSISDGKTSSPILQMTTMIGSQMRRPQSIESWQ